MALQSNAWLETTCQQSERDVLVILVHGTFARRAPWTQPGSNLRSTIEQLLLSKGRHVDFCSIEWTGKNKFKDRDWAADAIAERVRQAAIAYRAIFVVGHSHGGSAAAIFLKKHSDAARRVSGTAFLATPFYSIRIARFYQQVISYFLANLFLFVIPLSLNAIHQALISNWTFIELIGSSFWPVIHATTVAVVILEVISIGIFLFLLNSGILRRRQREVISRLASQISAYDTATLPNYPCTFIRTQGDEPGISLSAANFLNSVVRKLSPLLAGYIQIYRRFNKLKSMHWRVILTTGLVIYYLFSITYYGWYRLSAEGVRVYDDSVGSWGVFTDVLTASSKMILTELTKAFSSFWNNGQISIFTLAGLTQSVLIISLVVAIGLNALVFLCLISFVVFLFGYMLSACALFASGWLSFNQSLYCDLSAEPVPSGSHEVYTVSWSAYSTQERLSHSVVYEDAGALLRLGDFIDRRLA